MSFEFERRCEKDRETLRVDLGYILQTLPGKYRRL
jgi:hypothetical protein